MKINRKIATLGLIGCIAVPSFAVAQSGPDRDIRDRPGVERFQDSPRDHGPRWHKHMRRDRNHGGGLWRVARQLSAAETALGITPEQGNAWRGFTSAMIAFVDAGRPGMSSGAEGDSAEPASAEPQNGGAPGNGRSLTDLRGVQRFERFVDAQVRKGEAAERLKTALAELSSVLTPEQVQTADRLLRDLRGPGRHAFGKGPHRDGGRWHRGPAEMRPAPEADDAQAGPEDQEQVPPTR